MHGCLSTTRARGKQRQRLLPHKTAVEIARWWISSPQSMMELQGGLPVLSGDGSNEA